MSQPVQNDDIYADWDYDANSDFGLDDYSEQDAEFGINDMGQGLNVLSIAGEWQRIDSMESNPDLSATSKAELDDLQRKLNYIASLTGDELSTALSEVDAELTQLEKPNGKSGNNASLDQQIEEFKESHPEMSNEQEAQLDKWIAAYDLDPASESLIKNEFQDLQNQVLGTSVYSETVNRVATATGMKMSAVQAVFEKHGISDTENLSDNEIAEVLPELCGKDLSAAKDNLKTAEDALLKKWDSATKKASELHLAIAKGDDVKSTSVFQTVKDLANHEAPESKTYEQALCEVADATKSVLAALKDIPEDRVKVMSGSENASDGNTFSGCLSIDGKIYNVVPDSTSGVVNLSADAITRPDFDVDETKDAASHWLRNYGFIFN